ncbi:MAG TPA: LysM peptidoglycan-binding domain-containing protein [Actinomycetota bacterium]|nr:LysM peptidoglycan-binding domain-containing protein [Actinomycetota bacterium]
MRFAGYRGRHLRPRPRRRGPVVLGTAAAIWVGQCAVAYAGDHVVSKGETLSDIAVRYGTTTGALARANGLNDPNFIVAGTRLTITTGGASSSAGGSTHTIRAGETLWDLAQRFGTTVDALARANGISNPNLVVAGTTISVSGGDGGSAPVAMSGASHSVQAGETLSDIAARFGVSVSSLARANGISNPNFIVAGTSITVPGSGGSASTTAPAPVSSNEVGYFLEQEAVANGVNPSLIKAMAYQESGWQQDVVSSAGAIGVMQVMPATARWVNKVLLGGTSLNVRSAQDNIRMGVSYMRYLLSIMPTQDEALAAYYSGPGNVGSKLHRYQRVYVDAVNAHVTRF